MITLIYSNQIIQYVFLLVIVLLAYILTDKIIKRSKKKKFIMKSFLQKKEQTDSKLTYFEKFTSFQKYKRHLQAELNESNSPESVEKYLIKRVCFSLLATLQMFFIYIVTDYAFFLILSIPAAILAFFLQGKQLAKLKNRNYVKKKKQLLDYLIHFALLLKNYTPKDAVIKSRDYAGPLIKPKVNELLTKINLNNGSHEPFYEFANDLNMYEAREFMAAVEQLVKVNAKDAELIIKTQINNLHDKQEEAYEEQVEIQASLVEPYLISMLYPQFIILMIMLIVLIIEILSSLF